MLDTTDRKDRKDLLGNEPLKNLLKNTQKKEGSGRCSNRGRLTRLHEWNPSRVFLEGKNDIQPDGLVTNVCKGTYILYIGNSIFITNMQAY